MQTTKTPVTALTAGTTVLVAHLAGKDGLAQMKAAVKNAEPATVASVEHVGSRATANRNVFQVFRVTLEDGREFETLSNQKVYVRED